MRSWLSPTEMPFLMKSFPVDERVLMREMLVADVRWLPVLEEPAGVEVVIVVACGRHDVDEGVGNGNHVESLLVHLHRVGVAIVPKAHQHAVGGDGCHPLGMRQAAPEDGLLAVALDLVAEVDNEFAETLAGGGVAVAVLVRADMEAGTGEDWVRAAKVLGIEAVEERDEGRIVEVEVRVVVVLGCQRRTVVRESQAMGRHVELRDDLHAHRPGIADELTHLLLRVAAVDGGQAGEDFALHAEGGIGVVPAVLELVLEAVVVEVQLQGVHLVVRHDVDERIEIAQGVELACCIEHEAANGIVGLVGNGEAGKQSLGRHSGFVFRKVRGLHLEQRLCSPQGSLHGCGLDVNLFWADNKTVALAAQVLVILQREEDGTCLALLLQGSGGCDLPGVAQIGSNVLQRRMVVADAVEVTDICGPLARFRLLRAGDAKRLGCTAHDAEDGHQHKHKK